jgi:beta-N-acetylglucosaminidase
MNALSTSTLSGQMAPYQWLATYRQLSAQHSAEMQAIFMHAPEYQNGPLGLTNKWEGLYDQATDKNGVLQPDKLRQIQHQWRSEHSAAEYAAVQSEIRANDSKYPMLQMYHKTLDAYDNWQADWCQQNGVDRSTLQSELSGYAEVYNDRNQSRAWVVSHPDITQFENAKKSEFESGQSHYGEAGLMYALFFNPTAADRYLTVSGETPQQVEQGVQKEQVPAAP